ncbi:hypothetical protein GCM10022253_24230 [Sphingomonas endophytica]|uniref:Transmembrane protein n=1 Tax=Sphingomonas endophytica TaxID=869719 RepID=A0ABR6N2R1_9SPHN|nr:hypothetical protein [Sphingomonas endophytica]MBB5725071.1 hypothetical protein [Sphingomonas endophytica]
MPWYITLYVYGFWPVLIATVALAWRKGDVPLRAAGLLYVVATVSEAVARRSKAMPWKEFDLSFATIDTALLIGLSILALRFNRLWLIFSASLQLISVVGHIMRIAHPHILPLTYAILTGSSGYICLAMMFMASLFAKRE